MSVSEIVTAAVEPANKLIEVVSGAIGTAYEPRHIKKMADARAYELRTIGEELRNNSDLPIVYDGTGNYSIDLSDYDALAKRTGKRIAFREIAKQENIETIIDNAYETVKGIESCAEGDISREWMHKFIDAAGDISTEEMQKIWSKVLAGEVLDPASFSLRTLECLRNMDVSDARLFKSLCALIINHNMVISNEDFLANHEIGYDSILKLDEGGLINSSGTISRKFEISNDPSIVIDFEKYILVGMADKEIEVIIGMFPLTTAGRELSKLVNEEMTIETIKEICNVVQKNNRHAKFSLHKVNFREGNQINFSDESITFENNI